MAAGAVTAVVAAGSSARGAVNLLADPGFETTQGNVDASTGDKNAATGWTVFGSGYTTASVFRTGTQGFKTFGQYNGAFQQFTVVPGQSYTATVYSADSSTDKEANGNVNDLEINFFTGTDINFGTAAFNTDPVITVNSATPLDTFVQGTLTVTVPAGYTVMRYQINPSVYNGGSAFWDDATLVNNAAAVPEPATAALAVAAAVPALLGRRRRRLAAAAG